VPSEHSHPGRDAASASASIELLRRIQAGDRQAWEDLYLRYRDRLLLSIRCRLGQELRSKLQSEDILQSVFKDVLGELGGVEHRRAGSLDSYLHVCVLNKIRNKADFFGAKKRTGDTPLTDSVLESLRAPAASDLGYLDHERYERLERAIAALPPEMKETILLRRVEGFTNQEAAAALGKSPDATSKIYNRALARLGLALQKVRA
jgi:RNA polymerase sigma-70 factor (ECF subfamily)